VSARTYRGQRRRVLRELREAERCEVCRFRTPAGMMLETPWGRMCAICAVKRARGREVGEARRGA
jgi:hypothetical protein